MKTVRVVGSGPLALPPAAVHVHVLLVCLLHPSFLPHDPGGILEDDHLAFRVVVVTTCKAIRVHVLRQPPHARVSTKYPRCLEGTRARCRPAHIVVRHDRHAVMARAAQHAFDSIPETSLEGLDLKKPKHADPNLSIARRVI